MHSLSESLRQMLALLEQERQALAALDMERILTCSDGKMDLCQRIDTANPQNLNEECRGLLDGVTRLNETNRKMRNLIAANVEARLSALTGHVGIYGSRPAAVQEMRR